MRGILPDRQCGAASNGYDMLKLLVVYIRLGDTLKKVKPATLLVHEMADLTQHYRDTFRKSPDHFNSTTELQGFAPVRLEFTALCPTVGLVAVAPHTPQTKSD